MTTRPVLSGADLHTLNMACGCSRGASSTRPVGGPSHDCMRAAWLCSRKSCSSPVTAAQAPRNHRLADPELPQAALAARLRHHAERG